MSSVLQPVRERMRLGWSRFIDPHVQDRLIHEEGEKVVEEIRRHPVTRVVPVIEVLAGMALFTVMPRAGHLWWLPMAVGLAIGLHGFWRMHTEFMDRFVVTNLRVFRVHGVLDQQFAMMPLSRVLDISMRRPFWGQTFGYATFTFETAAQDQGLREIHYVGEPDERLRLFTEVIIKAGLGPKLESSDLASGD